MSEGDEGGVGPASGEARGGHTLSQAAPIGRILGGTFRATTLAVPSLVENERNCIKTTKKLEMFILYLWEKPRLSRGYIPRRHADCVTVMRPEQRNQCSLQSMRFLTMYDPIINPKFMLVRNGGGFPKVEFLNPFPLVQGLGTCVGLRR
jgi:hypothetical protein